MEFQALSSVTPSHLECYHWVDLFGIEAEATVVTKDVLSKGRDEALVHDHHTETMWYSVDVVHVVLFLTALIALAT